MAEETPNQVCVSDHSGFLKTSMLQSNSHSLSILQFRMNKKRFLAIWILNFMDVYCLFNAVAAQTWKILPFFTLMFGYFLLLKIQKRKSDAVALSSPLSGKEPYFSQIASIFKDDLKPNLKSRHSKKQMSSLHFSY